MNLSTELEKERKRVNETLDRLVSDCGNVESRLKEAMGYTLNAPGKRIRAIVALWCCRAVNGDINRDGDIAAAVIEIVHTYSLIHDDLPAMDDDNMRRGMPSCHIAFDEATAILTGDALLTFAFAVLAEKISRGELAVEMIKRLCYAAGQGGMISGQMADIRAQNTKAGEELLKYIHINKTAKMFECAAVCGALAGGADQRQLECLSEYGLKLGLAFQIADDILDIHGSAEQLGKTPGKDRETDKLTYPAIFGVEKSTQLEKELAEQAIEALSDFGEQADMLRQLVLLLLERTG